MYYKILAVDTAILVTVTILFFSKLWHILEFFQLVSFFVLKVQNVLVIYLCTLDS
jgi:hypothetical protein